MKYWRLLTALLSFLGIACDRDSAQQQKQAEVPIAAGRHAEDDSSPHLAFVISRVYESQQRTEAAPWHAPGGDWTFFDCTTEGAAPASFTVGVRTKAAGGGPIAWGEAIIVCPDRDHGVRMLDLMATAFQHSAPAKRSPQPLKAAVIPTAILGIDLKGNGGTFGGKGGGWTATKWFLQFEAREAEVYFNYNIKARRGEFSEKDEGYREDLIEQLAILLRDGPRPQRTPANDPNLTDSGPRIDNLRTLSAFKHGQASFTPGGSSVVFSTTKGSGPSLLSLTPVANPDHPVELARVDRYLERFACCEDEAIHLLLQEVIPQQPHAISSADPKRLWWVDRSRSVRRQLTGPWGEQGEWYSERPISPDARYVVVQAWEQEGNGPRRRPVTYVAQTASEGHVRLQLPPETTTHLGWTGIGANLRAIVQTGDSWDKASVLKLWLADPATGQCLPAAPQTKDGIADAALSPDGKWRAQFVPKDKLIITDTATGQQRTFTFHEDDLRFVGEDCVRWCDPHYLRFSASQLAFIDARTLKMNYPAKKEDLEGSVEFSPDFRHVLVHQEDTLRLENIVIPAN